MRLRDYVLALTALAFLGAIGFCAYYATAALICAVRSVC